METEKKRKARLGRSHRRAEGRQAEAYAVSGHEAWRQFRFL